MKSNSDCKKSRSGYRKSFCRFIYSFLVTSISAGPLLHAEDIRLTIKDFLYEHTPSYGNYCGPNITYGGLNSLLCPLPVDDIDAACAAHDYLYWRSSENDYFPRALADLKLTGAFLTTPTISLHSLGYSIAGSAVMPLQSLYWTAKGISSEASESMNGIASLLKKHKEQHFAESQVYQDQQNRYYEKIIRLNDEKYKRIITEAFQRESEKAKEAYRYWGDYYDKIMKQAAEKYSNAYH